jgi:hypothetical protein
MNIPPKMTQDKKCGKYDTLCVKRLNAADRTSFNKSEKIIGIGKHIARFRRLIKIVFFNALKNALFDKNCPKNLNPTQSLLSIGEVSL